jgi:XTP/dITP diphosphohydrolase
MRLLVASTNPGKIREIRDILRPLSIDVVTLDDLPPIEAPEETGATFAENARLKARAYAVHSGLPTVAEDSGLAIDALGGRPGIESARYPGKTYAEKFANLYRELASHPRPWTARFVCALAFIEPADGESAEPAYRTEATVEGEIAAEPRGSNGFGYDPIFFYPPYGRTLGEVADEQKAAVGHRGKAFRQFGEWMGKRLET